MELPSHVPHERLKQLFEDRRLDATILGSCAARDCRNFCRLLRRSLCLRTGGISSARPVDSMLGTREKLRMSKGAFSRTSDELSAQGGSEVDLAVVFSPSQVSLVQSRPAPAPMPLKISRRRGFRPRKDIVERAQR